MSTVSVTESLKQNLEEVNAEQTYEDLPFQRFLPEDSSWEHSAFQTDLLAQNLFSGSELLNHFHLTASPINFYKFHPKSDDDIQSTSHISPVEIQDTDSSASTITLIDSYRNPSYKLQTRQPPKTQPKESSNTRPPFCPISEFPTLTRQDFIQLRTQIVRSQTSPHSPPTHTSPDLSLSPQIISFLDETPPPSTQQEAVTTYDSTQLQSQRLRGPSTPHFSPIHPSPDLSLSPQMSSSVNENPFPFIQQSALTTQDFIQLHSQSLIGSPTPLSPVHSLPDLSLSPQTSSSVNETPSSSTPKKTPTAPKKQNSALKTGSSWNKGDLKKLKILITKTKSSSGIPQWKKIATHFKGRHTRHHCRAEAISQGYYQVAKQTTHIYWTKEENDTLRVEFEQYLETLPKGTTTKASCRIWEAISKKIPRHIPMACYRKAKALELLPITKRTNTLTTWKKSETKLLQELVQKLFKQTRKPMPTAHKSTSWEFISEKISEISSKPHSPKDCLKKAKDLGLIKTRQA